MTHDDIIRMAHEAGDLFVTQFGVASATPEWLERFAALVAAAEREAILDEWADRVQSDLEHGVRYLNERAAKAWEEKYPGMAGFADAIYAKGNT